MLILETTESNTNRNNTSHDNWDDTSHDEVRSEDTHCRDTNTRLGGTITRSWLKYENFTRIGTDLAPIPAQRSEQEMDVE